ncbi:hypothetical protein DFH09DRAFT_1221105 [Mycena vulgaris]|nr:hypothetical protein DFH09DRAFT_1221105 [Mycena vulgaris]
MPNLTSLSHRAVPSPHQHPHPHHARRGCTIRRRNPTRRIVRWIARVVMGAGVGRSTRIVRVGIIIRTHRTHRTTRPPRSPPRARTKRSGGLWAAPGGGRATRGDGGACSARGRVCWRWRCGALEPPLTPTSAPMFRPASPTPHAACAHLVSWFLAALAASFSVHRMAPAGKDNARRHVRRVRAGRQRRHRRHAVPNRDLRGLALARALAAAQSHSRASSGHSSSRGHGKLETKVWGTALYCCCPGFGWGSTG